MTILVTISAFLVIGRLCVSILMYYEVDVSRGTASRYLFEFYRHIDYFDYSILGNFIDSQERQKLYEKLYEEGSLDIEKDLKEVQNLLDQNKF